MTVYDLFVKLKILWQKHLIYMRWDGYIRRRGKALFDKKQEIYSNYLIADKNNREDDKNFYKAQLEIIDFITNEKTLD